jgi:hypothetical protein
MGNETTMDFVAWVQSRVKSELGIVLDRDTVAAVLRAERDWRTHEVLAPVRIPIS